MVSQTACCMLVCLLVGTAGVSAFRPAVTEELNELSSSLTLQLAQANPELGFQLWSTVYKKTYAEDASERFNIWKSNVAYIAKTNAEQSSVVLGLNEFADLTKEEFAAKYLGVNPAVGGTMRERKADTPFMYADAVDIPDEVDWRKEGVVTPVKNQMMCGSCWAFSTTGSVEGINAIKTGKLVSLSEQELVDCDTSKDNGCGGGLMDFAFEYILKNGGLDTEADYPYYSFGTWCNRAKENRTVVTIDGYEDVPVNDEGALKKAIAHQPVSVAICASGGLQFYQSGIVEKCCEELDHGVLAVGYGEEGGVPYYIVKNSWGGGWGEEGFFRLKAETGNSGMCGITKAASYPVKTSPNPPPQPESCGWWGWTTCEAGAECYCSMPFIFDFLCLKYGCQDIPQ